MTYTYSEALKESIKYFNGDELAAKVFLDKYALQNDNGELLEKTPTDMHYRLAKELACMEQATFAKPISAQQIFSYLDKFKYIVPQGSILYGLGNTYQYVSLSNCFALQQPYDSYGGIHHTDQHITQICKRRGGVGVDISTLRPDGAPTKNSSKTSSGPISFSERFAHSIREVGQSGRRGALNLSMNVHHPNIIDFSQCKLNRLKNTGTTISVKLTDEFLEAVKNDTEYEQRWPVDSKKPTISQMVNANKVWKIIAKCAWDSAEPGLLFWDHIIRESPADCYAEDGFTTVGINPCSELPLCVGGSCLLLIINLFGYVVNPFTNKAYFDTKLFYKHVQIAQRLADDIVSLELQHIERIIQKIKDDSEPEHIKEVELQLWYEVKSKCQAGRRTGVGPTGLGDALAALNIKYGSKKSVKFVDETYRILKFGSYRASVDMAKEKEPFPIWSWNREKNNPFIKRIKDENITIDGKIIKGSDLHRDIRKFGRRNIANLTSSPGGTISLLTQTTSGFEPLYFIKNERRKKVCKNDKQARVDFVDDSGDQWMKFEFLHPKLQMWMDITGKDNIKESPWWECCAEDLDSQDRIKMQSIAQQHIDHGMSVTINSPENITQKAVREIYEMAWKQKLKGITVYRKNCRDGVILGVDKPAERGILKGETVVTRPRELSCDVHHIMVKGQQYFVLVGLVNKKPYEVFAGRNNFLSSKIISGKIIRKRKGYYIAIFNNSDVELSPITASASEEEEAITRLTSAALRHGTDIYFLVKQLEKVGHESSLNNFAKSISRALKKYIQDGTKEQEACPECKKESLIRQSGCIICELCGWSRCL